MQEQYSFDAPWGLLLRIMTVVSIGLLLGIFYTGIKFGPEESVIWDMVMIALPLVMLVCAGFFSIRGYILFEDTLFVKRVGWYSKIELNELIGVEVDPKAMAKSKRRFGNGGMFCFAGFFKNKKIGKYRAFATDPGRAVVLRFSGRSVVVTPGNPVEFAKRVKAVRNLD